jgi:pyruvate kinase
MTSPNGAAQGTGRGPFGGALLNRRRTKIVATLGPGSSSPERIEQLMEAGVDVFRMNMSHGDHATHRTVYGTVREIADRRNLPVAILSDLSGPKIRVGRFEGGSIELRNGEQVRVTAAAVRGTPGLIPSQYALLAQDVRPSSRILLDDGLLELRVEAVEDGDVTCTVVEGGILKDHKGMNLPDVAVSAPSLSEKDRDDVVFGLELGVDFFALSFVRGPDCVADLRSLIPAGNHAQIIAKIEKPEALERIDEILELADGLMVARGDLGVELPPEIVPVAQRRLLAKAQAANKPVIVATQMLETMTERPTPTRAEASDVATAVFGGTDAVMLSAETATGRYPVRTVEIMNRIARRAELSQWEDERFRTELPTADAPLGVALAAARAVAQLTRDLRIRCVVVLSETGATARVVAGTRPAAPVLAVTSNRATWRQMNLLWGVVPVFVDAGEADDLPALARRLATEFGLASAGDLIFGLAGLGGASPPATMTILEV